MTVEKNNEYLDKKMSELDKQIETKAKEIVSRLEHFLVVIDEVSNTRLYRCVVCKRAYSKHQGNLPCIL